MLLDMQIMLGKKLVRVAVVVAVVVAVAVVVVAAAAAAAAVIVSILCFFEKVVKLGGGKANCFVLKMES